MMRIFCLRHIRCILAAATVVLFALPAAGDEKRTSNGDRDVLIALENEWLANEHDPAELERILAADFLHPVVTGDVLTKPQHINSLQHTFRHPISRNTSKLFRFVFMAMSVLSTAW